METAVKTIPTQKTISFKSVLFPTDFSLAADSARPYALEIARRYGAKIIGVYVRPPEIYGVEAMAAGRGLASEDAELVKEETSRLEKMLSDVPNEVVIGEGSILGVLSTAIEENHVDLIVMGTHGRTGFRKALLGSIAEKIFREASCPVMTIGPHVKGETWHLTETKEILFATDFSAGSLAAAPYAISLAQEHQAKLVLLHVIPSPRANELVQPHDIENAPLHKLQALVPAETELALEPSFIVEQGNPAEKILEVARKRRADLIVLGVKQAQGLMGGSTHLPWTIAHEIVAHAACPVLTVRG
jgi:nucleotide-binding universal stress UspA family protein